MSGRDFYRAVSQRTGIAQIDIHNILRAASNVVYDTLNADKKERIVFGTLGFFKVRHVKEHKFISNLEEYKGKAFVTPEHDEIVFIPFTNRRDLDESNNEDGYYDEDYDEDYDDYDDYDEIGGKSYAL